MVFEKFFLFGGLLSSLLQQFSSFIPGSRLVDGGDCLALAKASVSGGTIAVAFAGGGQAGCQNPPYLAGFYINEVLAVTSANDSVSLPLAVPGAETTVINSAAANSLQLFGQASNPNNGGAGDTIIPHNSSTPAATGTGIAVAAGNTVVCSCARAGVWKSQLNT
jgi:hypothetical protein